VTLVAILAAAGRGDRLGQPKQLLDLAGKPVVAWSLELFERSPLVDAIYIACEPEQRDLFEAAAAEHAPSRTRAIVLGGDTRQASVYAALSAISPAPGFVLVHDGARPFLSHDVLGRVVAAAQRTGAAIAAMPVKDTVKLASGRMIERTLSREALWSAQTPQAFAYELFIAAHAQALADGYVGTDDAALVERMGTPVELVMGSYGNLKITTPEDLEVARHLAARPEIARR
jgi:2-C-methyl-D-erythritol 4-phosphate cytidylyltransferase